MASQGVFVLEYDTASSGVRLLGQPHEEKAARSKLWRHARVPTDVICPEDKETNRDETDYSDEENCDESTPSTLVCIPIDVH